MEADLKALDRIRKTAELIHSPAAVRDAVERMARQVTHRLANRNPIVLAVMTGGVVPAVWLQSHLGFPNQLDYVHLTRYLGDTRGGSLTWLARPRLKLAGRSVLVVDDILDEGPTLKAILQFCREEGAREVLSAVLVLKQHERRVPDLAADFVGLEVEDRYVFGCGMDYREYFRNLDGIYALPEDGESG